MPHRPQDAAAGVGAGSDAAEPEAREHEPLVGLDGGWDGLELQRRVAREARGWPVPGGYVLSEVGEDQEQDCIRLLLDAGFRSWSEGCEDLGVTVVIGRAPAG
ncbi:hypothetical protein [Arthrobacter ruber]|uniref:hypothetical protein n=1 Tax=Arthrobacter ruber TaxID=1258893 RepID=UPI000CF5666A|nr:hypothetical protein [Arthrobacter ruber]